jgi:hypothetical protein
LPWGKIITCEFISSHIRNFLFCLRLFSELAKWDHRLRHCKPANHIHSTNPLISASLLLSRFAVSRTCRFSAQHWTKQGELYYQTPFRQKLKKTALTSGEYLGDSKSYEKML